jgi:hypothetical protein
VGVPRVLAEEERHLAVLEIGARVRAHHLVGDPELAGLFLGKGARAMDRAERGACRASVGPRKMVPLAAAAVIEDRFAAVRVADLRESLGDFTDGGFPVHLFVGPVAAPAQRSGQAVRPVLVEVEAVRLLARVALRDRVRVVPAEPHEAATFLAAELDLDAAVALAEDAGRGLPFGVRGDGLGHWRLLSAFRRALGRGREGACRGDAVGANGSGCLMQLICAAMLRP